MKRNVNNQSLLPLAFEKRRGDLIKTYKVPTMGHDRMGRSFRPGWGVENQDLDLILRTSRRIRGRPCGTEVRKHLLSQRVVNLWTSDQRGPWSC